MKKAYPYITIASLLLNIYLLFSASEITKPYGVKTVKVAHSDQEGRPEVSEDTTVFLMDFASNIAKCETFLWTSSENRREIKYVIWFSKKPN